MPTDPATFLSLAEAAEIVGRSTRTIRRWVRCGDLPRTMRIKGRLLIYSGDIAAMYRLASES